MILSVRIPNGDGTYFEDLSLNSKHTDFADLLADYTFRQRYLKPIIKTKKRTPDIFKFTINTTSPFAYLRLTDAEECRETFA